MIKSFKKFKLFENNEVEKELIEQLGDDDIDYFYRRNHKMDADEIIDYWPDSIWDYIDDNKFIEDFIDDEVNSRTLEDFSEDDFKRYIEDNLSDRKKEKILNIYKSNNYDEDEDEEINFEDHMIDELSEDELKEVIQDDYEESEFMESVIRNWHYNDDAKSIFEEFYGYKSFKDIYEKEKYNNKVHEIVKNLLSTFRNYVDDDKLEKNYLDETDYDTKVENVRDDISYDRKLQKKLLKINRKNVLLLVDLFNKKSNIGDEYDFQKTYIEEYLNDWISDDEENYSEEEKKDIIAKALKYLHDKFGIHPKIENEYEDELWLVHSAKYNM